MRADTRCSGPGATAPQEPAFARTTRRAAHVARRLQPLSAERGTCPMRTLAQISANRLNARRSTGPRTPSGKAAVSQNALKHGLLARAVLLPDDGAAATRAVAALATSLHTELKPEGPIEHALVDRIVASLWRLRRLAHVESGLFASRLCEDQVSAAAREAQLASQGETWVDDLQRRHVPLVSAGVVQVAHRARYRAALTAARNAELNAARRIPRLGRAFVAEERTFARLSRYEATIERGLYKTLHELERLQRLRAGDAVPAPQAVDVNLDVRFAADRGVRGGEPTPATGEDRTPSAVTNAIAFKPEDRVP